jgi:hypothetical protein
MLLSERRFGPGQYVRKPPRSKIPDDERADASFIFGVREKYEDGERLQGKRTKFSMRCDMRPVPSKGAGAFELALDSEDR